MTSGILSLLGFDNSEFVALADKWAKTSEDPISALVERLTLIAQQPEPYNPESWLFKPDEDIQRTQEAIVAKYPELTAAGLTTPRVMRRLLAWVERVDLLKDDDGTLGKYNWSYTAKHIAERELKQYISNSQMILAAIMCGYLPDYVSRTNCDFKKGWWYEQ